MIVQRDTKKNNIFKIKSVLFVLLLWGASSTYASWAPLQDVEAGKETDGSTTTVWYRVYDPVLEEWKEGSSSLSGYNIDSIELTNTDGVVAWLASKSGNYKIGYAVYDPSRGQWVENEDSYSNTVSQLKNDDGVVCWLYRYYASYEWGTWKGWDVIYVVYDPKLGAWQKNTSGHSETKVNEDPYSNSYSNFNFRIKDGVVAWTVNYIRQGWGSSSRSYKVKYGLYDPANQSWQEGSQSYSNSISSLSIQNGTVHYSVDDTDYTRGYDTSVVSWYDGATKPLAYFYASPVIGLIPLHVWFTDMSLGANSWDWDFGNDEYSTKRSPFNTYSNIGEFTVIQTVTGPEGSDSTTIDIATVTSLIENIIYVDDDAAGANDGSSWPNAYNYLQDALVNVKSSYRPGESIEIHVAQGVYTPDSNSAIPAGTSDREATFDLINGVSLIGGYAGFSEPDPNDRDIVTYETILSGDLSRNDIEVNNPWELKNEPTRYENSDHVITSNNLTNETAVLDGFTITASRRHGMYNNDSNPNLYNCTFSWNYASTYCGGMYNRYSSPILINCIFINNYAYDTGGGMYNNNSDPMLTNCIFKNNYAQYGGGMYNSQSNPTLTNCIFSTNFTTYRITNWNPSGGGGMYNYDSNPTLTNCIFIGNYCRDHFPGGGGMYNSDSSPTLTNCTFSGNFLDGIRNGSNCSTTITNCILWYNIPHQIDLADTNISYSNIQDGVIGKGNIDLDPLFVSPGYWVNANNLSIVVEPNDPNAVWIDGDYHLKSEVGRWDSISQIWVMDAVSSPCIDAGDPNSPIGDEPEPNGGRINMGAYGGTTEASKSK